MGFSVHLMRGLLHRTLFFVILRAILTAFAAYLRYKH